MEVYAKQTMNIEAERQAASIRLRAERRAGEMMKAMERASPQTANISGKAKDPAAMVAGGPSYRQSLESAGVNERTARRHYDHGIMKDVGRLQ